MNPLKKAAFLTSTYLALNGCAATVTAWKNDPLQSYDVKDAAIYAMTGDRRTAVFTRDNPQGALRFCAESMPDAVSVFTGSSSVDAKADGVTKTLSAQVGIKDATAAGVLQTFQRTEIADVLRQLGWNTCLAWAQGAITQPQYKDLLERIVEGSLAVMKTRSGQTQILQTIPSAGLVVSTTAPAPSPTPTPTPTPTPPKPTPTPTSTPTPT